MVSWDGGHDYDVPNFRTGTFDRWVIVNYGDLDIEAVDRTRCGDMGNGVEELQDPIFIRRDFWSKLDGVFRIDDFGVL